MSERQILAQQIIGWVCILTFLFLAYQSLDPALTLSWPVIVGLLAIIAMCLRKLDSLTDFMEALAGLFNNGKK